MSDSKQTVDRSQLDDEQQAQSPSASAPGAEPERSGEAASALDGDRAVGAAGAADGDDATEVEGDLDELVAVGRTRDDYLALAQRTQADFENYRKRVARESALAQERGVAKLAKELLPAIDNLDRALEKAGSAAGGAAQDDPLLEGVRLVRSELA